VCFLVLLMLLLMLSSLLLSYWLSFSAFSYEQVIVSFYSLLAMISPMAVAKPVIAYVFICRCLNVVDG
jgi:hypothetical protein